MKTSLSRLLTTTALGAPLALGTFAADASSDIGKVAAVNPSMDGTPPASNARQLSVGAGVLQNERIETSEDGSGQLLFLDQTSLSIAPRSDIVLDRYVYDPAQESGEVAVTLTKGVLRLIGGRITKRTDGIIRTPTATIGVRGGLALVIVDPDGQTRVCHVAGEYTKVDSLAGGQVVLSRPNACAVVAAGVQPTFEGLIESEELAEIYRQLEGKGDGGRTIAADTIDTADVSSVNSSEKRGPNDTPVSTSGHSFVPEEVSRDEDQDRQDEDVRALVVEVPNNNVAPPPPQVEPPFTPPVDPPAGPFVTGLAGGSVINPGSGATGTTFVQVLQGSLIGEGADFSELRIPVPDTDGAFDAEFDTDNIIATFIPRNADFNATDLAPGSGLFEFFLFDEEFDEDTGDIIGGSSSSVLGDIEGVGFTDQSEEFTYVEFSSEDTGARSTGFAVFGNPTFGQSQFAEGDATISIADTASFESTNGNVLNTPTKLPLEFFVAEINPALLNDTLVNGVANTVEGFAVQPNQFLHVVREDEPLRGQTPFFMVGNQGFARYGRNDTFIDAGPEIAGSDLVGGGKWLNGALHISGAATDGPQESSFFLFADDIKSFDGSGPVVSGKSFFSDFLIVEDPEIGANPVFTVGSSNLGTLEDQDGNTVFGETNRYMVLSNLHRANLFAGDSAPTPFSNDAGTATGLIQISGDTSFDGTTNVYDEISGSNSDFNSLLARDASLDETIANPLPLAGARIETFYDFENGGRGVSPRQVDVLDRGFAAGMAVCEGGQCGDVDTFNLRNTGLPNSIDEFSGSYTVRTGVFQNFSMTFGGHDLVAGTGTGSGTTFDAVNFDTSNQVDVSFQVRSTGVGQEVTDSNIEGFTSASYTFNGGGTTSAFIDDNRFAALGLENNATVSTDGVTATTVASLAIASAGLVGTSELTFPAGTNLNPQFARWGWWSAEIEAPTGLTDNPTETTRTDIIHLGNWVAGVASDTALDDIPFFGVASFDGLAVGTMTDLANFDRQIVGGSFNMTFDFGRRTGNFNLNIPDASINENVAISGFGSDGFTGRNSNVANSRLTDVAGAFFANPNAAGVTTSSLTDGIAGVGGTFESTDTLNQVQTVGVFAGDRTNFNPLGTDTVTGPDSIPGSGVTPGNTAGGGTLPPVNNPTP